jgi:predicted GIY-YIG superfamily endonuclease
MDDGIVAILPPQSTFYCYIIASGNRTYNGYTNNLTRRLRQHNREIKGGARATSIQGNNADGTTIPWNYIAILTCPTWTAQRAMQVEWNIKYPTRHKPRERCFQGSNGRINSFIEVFKFVQDSNMTLYIHNDYIDIMTNYKNTGIINNVSICLLSELI